MTARVLDFPTRPLPGPDTRKKELCSRCGAVGDHHSPLCHDEKGTRTVLSDNTVRAAVAELERQGCYIGYLASHIPF